MERRAVRLAATLFKVLVLEISAAFVGIVPVAVLIVTFQEHGVSGLTFGALRDEEF
jgi:ABC-type glycerol-3-phosphate transport system permease component